MSEYIYLTETFIWNRFNGSLIYDIEHLKLQLRILRLLYEVALFILNANIF
jgi:hypothetical protein